MSYTVGQVLYIILKKETRLYPMQVVEEITKKTLEGEVTNYVVRGGKDPKSQLLITEIDGEIFDSADKARDVLIERATSSITRLVATAVEKAEEWYPNSFEAPAEDDSISLSKLKKVTTPPAKASPPRPKAKPGRGRELAELASELQRESDEIAEKEGPTITLPDGSKAKVRSVKLPDELS